MGIICCGCCFQSLSAKTNELILIVANIFCLFLFSFCFFIIKWSEIHFLNLKIFIALLLILIVCLVFTFMLRCWRSSGKIKTTKRETGIKIVTAEFIITVINLVICIIEEVVVLVSYAKKMVCDNDDDETYNDRLQSYYRRRLNKNEITELNELSQCKEKKATKSREYYIANVTLSYMDCMLILSLCILSILKRRIINKVDDDLPPVITGMSPYGRQVIIVHPGNNMGMQNYNYYNNDSNYNNNYNLQNMNFGKKKHSPYSNQYVQAQNVNVVSSKIKNQNISSSKDKSYSSSRNFE